MMRAFVRTSAVLAIFALGLSALWGCGEDENKTSSQRSQARGSGVSFSIVSGSENEALEPIIRDFAQKEGVALDIKYMGSIDMTLALSEQGNKIPYDAVWPANSIWITLGDQQNVVKHVESIMRSPVILGVRKSIAERLGWIDSKDIAISDILAATRAGKLRFAMTSATQSNSGASAYLGFLHALAGAPDVLLMEHLDDPEVQEKVRALLSMVNRSSGSSGWLEEMVTENYDRFQAMFNYEALIIEANRKLTANGREPLYAVYPIDGVMIADSPLGYVDKGDPKKAEFFQKLQAHLLSKDVQNRILRQGRRTGLVGMNPDIADKNVFNPDWGIDVARIISPVPTPAEPVIRKALDLYQVALRKPSCTAYVVDVSGSMNGQGIEDLKAAMTTLLDPVQARRFMLQPSPKDIHMIIPFNSAPLNGVRAVGNSEEVMQQLLAYVLQLNPGGGTNIYSAAARAVETMGEIENIEDYFPAVILMTDGKSSGDISELKEKLARLPLGSDIPIYSITFGDADESQLKEISAITVGRVFSGKNLVQAFRKAKGYN